MGSALAFGTAGGGNSCLGRSGVLFNGVGDMGCWCFGIYYCVPGFVKLDGGREGHGRPASPVDCGGVLILCMLGGRGAIGLVTFPHPVQVVGTKEKLFTPL